jgi:hypothetical protein
VTARALSGPLPPLAALVVVAAPSAGAYLGAARALGVPEVSRLRPSTRRRA